MAELLTDHRTQSPCDAVVAASDFDRVSAERGLGLRRVLLRLVEEAAGHRDLLREKTDGAVGEEPPA